MQPLSKIGNAVSTLVLSSQQAMEVTVGFAGCLSSAFWGVVGHAWQCSEVTPDSVLQDHSW